jgi:hypothetical protein
MEDKQWLGEWRCRETSANFFRTATLLDGKRRWLNISAIICPQSRKRFFCQPSRLLTNIMSRRSLVSEPGSKRADMPAFGPIAAHEAPKRYKTVKNYASGILAVDGPLKDIIERFEPGVHHFFPIEIVGRKDVVYPKKFFVMAIGQYLDSFSPEQSNPASWENSVEGYYRFDDGKKSMSGLALSRQVFGNAHLWRERRMLRELICFSDQLMANITGWGLRLPKNCKLKDI